MSNNLFKSNYVILRGDEKRVIDSNEQMEIKMNHLREIMKQELKDAENKADFSEGIDAQIVETLLEDFDNPESETGMSHLGVLKAEPAYTGPTHEELMEQVRMEADAMLAEASREAEAIKKAAHQEGYQRGLEEGNLQAEKKYQEKVEKLKFDQAKMEESYQNKLEEVEPLFVDALTGIYEHIFHCDLARFREVILFSIQNIIGGGESSKDFIIRVSQEDYAYISEKRLVINEMVSESSTVEILKDITLSQGQCMIETGGGIFDCGIDTQLVGLSRELKLLSYEKNK